MGTSTNGILCWGIPLPEEDESPAFMGEHTDFEDWLDEELGLVGKSWTERQEAWDAYPVDLVRHCSCEYPMWIVIPRGAQVTATRGDPTLVQLTDFIVAQDHINEFTEWCYERGIVDEPGLYVCSLWC